MFDKPTMQGNEELTMGYLKVIRNFWNTCVMLINNDFDILKVWIEDGENNIEIEQCFTLNNLVNTMLNFLYVLMELLAVQEKMNYLDAYMFGNIIEERLEADRDIFKIISTAGLGRRGR